MEYRHITTGVIVHSDSELPPAVYEKVDGGGAEPAETEKRRKARKATKEK